MDLEVVEVSLVDSTHAEVKLRGVQQLDTRPFNILATVNVDEIWSSIHVLLLVFTDPPHVALTVNYTFSLECQIFSTKELQEVSLGWD